MPAGLEIASGRATTGPALKVLPLGAAVAARRPPEVVVEVPVSLVVLALTARLPVARRASSPVFRPLTGTLSSVLPVLAEGTPRVGAPPVSVQVLAGAEPRPPHLAVRPRADAPFGVAA